MKKYGGMKTLGKIAVLFVVLVVSIVVSKNYARAANSAAVCDTEPILWDKFVNAYPALDIRRTVGSTIIYTMSGGVSTTAYGVGLGTAVQCGAKFVDENTEQTLGCAVDAEQCKSIEQVPDPTTAYYQEYTSSQSAGSLLGIANVLHGYVSHEPVPVNLAFYVNDNLARVPFVGKALAADTSTYSGPMLNTILELWKAVRNLAYGILSVIMVVIGIMIMSRRKINPQTIVTMQTALPRVVLAVILEYGFYLKRSDSANNRS